MKYRRIDFFTLTIAQEHSLLSRYVELVSSPSERMQVRLVRAGQGNRAKLVTSMYALICLAGQLISSAGYTRMYVIFIYSVSFQ